MRTLIKNGTIVTAVDQYKGDVLVEDEKITLIGTSLDMAADKTIDASGKYVLPGGIDVHTHLDMPFGGATSADDFESGTTAAAFGRTTAMIDVLVQRALAAGHTAPKYHALTRPARAEAEATHRAIALAEIADVPIYIVHLSAAEALEKVTEARDRGLLAYAETCPQYLFLSYDNYEEPDFGGSKYVMSPPLRDKAKQDQLWRGLAFNDLQCVSTDHCPFCMKEQKELGRNDFSKIPNGAPGIETRMSLVYDGGVRTGRISLNRFVELTSTSPAKIFGLFPRKGTIAPGSDADIVVFDPNRTITLSAKTLHMNVDNNPYEGRQVTGATDTVLSRGRVIIEDGTFVGRPGAGSFLKRATRS